MRVSLFVALAALIACVDPAFSSTEGTTNFEGAQKGEEKIPHSVGQNGNFSYSVPLEMPGFHGLVPRISLSYSSGTKAGGSEDAVIGSGWRIHGLSKIERVSIKRGAPTWDDAEDMFLLDGQELMACADSAATARWAGVYPEDLKTDRPSASCTAGGHFSTRLESDRKILRNTSDNSFTVFATDGTRYIYRSVATLKGASAGADVQLDRLLNKRAWYLAEIRDWQRNSNVVTVRWHFDADDGYTARPKRINYGGYSVIFLYQEMPTPVASFGTGTSIMGYQDFRLSGITAQYGSTNMWAKRLSYVTSEVNGVSLLRKIEAIGTDFSVSGSTIGGAALSGPHWFTYSTDKITFENTGLTFKSTPDVSIIDYDRNGTDDVIVPGRYVGKLECDDGDRDIPAISYGTKAYAFGKASARNVGELSLPPVLAIIGQNASGDTGRAPDSSKLEGFTRVDPDGTGVNGQIYALLRYTNSYERGDDNWRTVQWLTSHGTQPFEADLGRVGEDSLWGGIEVNQYSQRPIMGNFDGDVKSEYIFNGGIYDIDAGVSTRQSDFEGYPKILLDMDGDGAQEFLLAPVRDGMLFGDTWKVYDPKMLSGRVHKNNFRQRNVSSPDKNIFSHVVSFNSNKWSWTRPPPRTTVGDVNGDGFDDLIVLELLYGSQDRLYVSLSTGEKLLPLQRWGSGVGLPNYEPSQYNTHLHPAPSIEVRDVNGDGLGDLIYYMRGTSTGAQCGGLSRPGRVSAGSGIILTSDGSDFRAGISGEQRSLSYYHASGDFNGDGKLDILSGDQPPSIQAFANASSTFTEPFNTARALFGQGLLANTLTQLTDPQGQTVSVAYKPSSGAGMPGVQQVVGSITRWNGRGHSRVVSYGYTGPKYDWVNRKPLGFQSVTKYLPAIPGEGSAPYEVRTFLNDNTAVAGLLKSKTLVRGKAAFSKTVNHYDVEAAHLQTGKGPFTQRLTKVREQTWWGGAPIETAQQLSYSRYGQVTQKVSLGYTNGSGGNLSGHDDVTTWYDYRPNLSRYIVDKPRRTRVLAGTGNTSDTTKWLEQEFHYYDGSSTWNAEPVTGNLTRRVRSKDLPVAGKPVQNKQVFLATYDGRGRMIDSYDARGARVWRRWGAAAGQFVVLERQWPGTGGYHETATAYSVACSAPVTVTDPNGLHTSIAYDGHCRETRVTQPNGLYERTNYYGGGNGRWQRVYKIAQSGSNISGSTTTEKIDWIDGFGEVWRSETSGTTTATADRSVVLATFDGRGNLRTKSEPLTHAEAASNNAPAWKITTYSYDTLHRPTLREMPGGAEQRTAYGKTKIVHRGRTGITLPYSQTWGRGCAASQAAQTCERMQRMFDPWGRPIMVRAYDEHGTDVGLNAGWRITTLDYDRRGNLIYVQDPKGAVFNYAYDTDGNRTVSDDPGLGRWTMSYTPGGDLAKQTDAKGQEILFTYDDWGRVLTKQVRRPDGSTESLLTQAYDRVRSGYFNNGQLTDATLGAHTLYFDYDKAGQEQQRRETIDGKTYHFDTRYTVAGQPLRMTLLSQPGKTGRTWTGNYQYDAARRVRAFDTHLTSVSYNVRGQLAKARFGNGLYERRTYAAKTGFLTEIMVLNISNNAPRSWTRYTHSLDGQIQQMVTNELKGRLDFKYDYAGRLLSAVNAAADVDFNQSFGYDQAGRVRSNSRVGDYNYSATKPDHAPHRVTAADGGKTTFTYDANGNMLTGLNGKEMSYDAENRPLCVILNGKATVYQYGANGKRLKKIEDVLIPPNASCDALSADTVATGSTTLYLGSTEIRNWGQGTTEEILSYPVDSVRITSRYEGSTLKHDTAYLFRDHLSSVRAIFGASGERIKHSVYRPFGEAHDWTDKPAPAGETKGWIGERYDAGAGLQYLNARYYDPELGLFIQPDWFEVTKPGVGTNRYSYSANDPINRLDPEGNSWFTKAGKLAKNGGDLAMTLEGVAADVVTLTGSGFSLTQRAAAAVSIASEIGPVSARDVGDVYKLGRRGTLKVLGYQTHHIVPQSLRKHDGIKLTGFEIDGYANLIELPQGRVINGTRTVHNGPHRKEYTREFRELLDTVEADIKSGKITAAEGREIIAAKAAEIRSDLRSGKRDLNAASERQPARKSDEKPTDDNPNEDER